MASTPLTPASVVPVANTWTDLAPAPAAGKVQSINQRAANVGAADADAAVRVVNGGTTINRAKTYPVPYHTSESAPDLERRYPLKAGWKIQVWASAGANIEFSYDGWEDDV